MAEERNPYSLQIAHAVLAGFDKHYALFRYVSQQAKRRFEMADWHGLQRGARERIAFYDQRVAEATEHLQSEFNATMLDESEWQQVKQHYVRLLINHRQPELAETFFNSVVCRLLHRDYFNNTYIFYRPAVSTEYLDADPVSFRSYYPLLDGIHTVLKQILTDFGLACPFVNAPRDLRCVVRAARQYLPRPFYTEADCQLQVMSSLFYRNKGAYIIGRLVNGGLITPFAVPILRNARGQLILDTLLMEEDQIATLFSFARAYFLVDMETPAATVTFLRTLLPTKPRAEWYNMLGLQKQGKTLFFRDFLLHLRHSTDKFIIAPGIKGLVMSVFTLPSYPYVFKIIKDVRGKDITRETVQEKYNLVKIHDRVGRMSDAWEYSQVALPKSRCDEALIEELRLVAPSIVEEEDEHIVIKHVYIERRMTPLNLYIQSARPNELERAVIEYGNAIKDLAKANIFPGDMLYKNFGVTRLERVVFYDYDEVQYLTECHFRHIPPAPNPEAEMSGEPWYPIGPNDVFPEEFGPFLLGDARVRKIFMQHHADLLDPAFWIDCQQRIRAGEIQDLYPYARGLRFRHMFGKKTS